MGDKYDNGGENGYGGSKMRYYLSGLLLAGIGVLISRLATSNCVDIIGLTVAGVGALLGYYGMYRAVKEGG